jgi:signal transduction histidine kinase
MNLIFNYKKWYFSLVRLVQSIHLVYDKFDFKSLNKLNFLIPDNSVCQKKLLIILFILTVPFFSNSQATIQIKNNLSSIDVNNSIFICKSDNFNVNDILAIKNLQDSYFIQNTYEKEIGYGFTKQKAWCKLTLNNISDLPTILLHIEQSTIDSLSIYYKTGSDSIIKMPSLGRHVGFFNRPIADRNYVYPINITKNKSTIIYIYSTRKFGNHVLKVKIKSETQFRNYVNIFNIGAGGVVFSFLLAMLLCLILFFIIRDQSYLIFVIFCFITLLLSLADSGIINSFILAPKLQPILNLVTVISYYLVVGFHILFTIELLNIKTYNPWLYRFGLYCFSLFMFGAFLLLFPLPNAIIKFLVEIAYYFVFCMDAYIALVIIIAVRQKQQTAVFYMVGFFLTLLFVSLLLLSNLGVIDKLFKSDDLYYFIPLIEIYSVLIGLCIRFGSNYKEKLLIQKDLNIVQDKIITLQEDERKRIASDLHDEVGNSLAALKTKFLNENRQDDLSKTMKIIDSLRIITHNIMPADFNSTPFDELVANLVSQFATHPTTKFEFQVSGKVVDFNKNKAIALYRILNELITNILKHANASEVHIQLVYHPTSLILSIEDNGKNFEIKKQAKTGIGLKSIFERLAFLDADLDASTDKKGNLLIINLPII